MPASAITEIDSAARRGWPTSVGQTLRRDWSAPATRGIRMYPAALTVAAVYLCAAAAIMIPAGAGFSPAYTISAAIIIAATLLRARPLIWTAAVLLVAILLFFGLDNFTAHAATITHTLEPIRADAWLLRGGSAVVWSQSLLVGNPLHAILVPPLVVAYLSFWIGPVVVLVWMWQRHPGRLARFACAFVLLEALGYLIYLLFPETPPWLAAQQGFLPPLQREVVDALKPVLGLGTVYASSDPAPLSAMPSMHVAVPALIGLTLASPRSSRLSLLWLLYPLAVGIAVLGFAEHYLVDVLVAFLITGIAFFLTEFINARRPDLIGLGKDLATPTDGR